MHPILVSPAGRTVTAFVALFLILSLYFGAIHTTPSMKSLKDEAVNRPIEHQPLTFATALAKLYEPIRQVLDEAYVDTDQKSWRLSKRPHWTKPLGKKVLVVDMDTRIPKGDNELWNSTKLNWETMDTANGGQMVSMAFMNHYIYSQIHGYDYLYYAADHMKALHDTWIKPHVFWELLAEDKWQFIVFLDSDAILQHLEVPMEWLFNRWKIGANTSIALPTDTEQILNGDKATSWDSHGKVEQNTGVVILQNTPHAKEMVDAWRRCPDERRYPGCAQWRYAWSHEQRAFSNYIRYDYNETGNVVEIPCDEAQGYPGQLESSPPLISNCTGQFIRHFTTNKTLTKANVERVLMQSMSQVIQNALLTNKNDIWTKDSHHHYLENYNE